MYTAESIAPRKTKLQNDKIIYPFWYITSTLSLSLIYLFYNYYLHNSNIDFLILGVIISIFLVVIFQELAVKKHLDMFPYWAIILISGIILGCIFCLMFVGSLFYFVYQSSIFTASLSDKYGKNVSLILSVVLIPTVAAVIFVLFTYVLWFQVVKPIHNSSKLSEKNKLLFEGIISISVAVFVSLTLYVGLLIILFNNSLVAYLISAFAFSYLSFSGFKEVYAENAFFGVFLIKDFDQI